MKKKIWISVGVIAIILIIVGVIIYNKAVKEPPKDDTNVKILKYENLLGDQYAEVLVVWGNGITKNFIAGVYNTIGLNTPDGTGNTATDELLAELDLEKLKSENNALKIIKNAPRLWTVDWVEVNAGEVREFGGLKARWVMWFPIPESFIEGEQVNAYNKMEAIRKTHMGIKAGSPAFILDDPEGNTWVMKSASRVTSPRAEV